jgi:hypothetical protein
MMIPRGMGLTCQPPLIPTNTSEASIFKGALTCCGDPSSPDYNGATDPCSWTNTNPGFLAASAAANDPAAVSAATGGNPVAVDLTQYPENVQADAYACYSSPGATFTDHMGVVINCPAGSVMTPAGPVSKYSVVQLAAMLAPNATPKIPTAANLFSPGPFLPSVQPTQGQINNVAPEPKQLPVVPGAADTSTPGSNSGGSSSTSSSTSGVDLSFLTNSSLITGLPNWAVAVGVVAALMVLPGLMGGRR